MKFFKTLSFSFVGAIFGIIGGINSSLSLPLPHINQNASYRELREELINLGWQPTTQDVLSNQYATQERTILQSEGWTEIASCSQGINYCLFIFEDENGNSLKITTVNNLLQLPINNRYIIYGWNYQPTTR